MYNCKNCNKKYTSKGWYKKHIKCCTKEIKEINIKELKKLRCNNLLCYEIVINRVTKCTFCYRKLCDCCLDKHEKVCHKYSIKNIQLELDNMSKVCDVCNIKNIKDKMKNRDKWYTCRFCNKHFCTKCNYLHKMKYCFDCKRSINRCELNIYNVKKIKLYCVHDTLQIIKDQLIPKYLKIDIINSPTVCNICNIKNKKDKVENRNNWYCCLYCEKKFCTKCVYLHKMKYCYECERFINMCEMNEYNETIKHLYCSHDTLKIFHIKEHKLREKLKFEICTNNHILKENLKFEICAKNKNKCVKCNYLFNKKDNKFTCECLQVFCNNCKNSHFQTHCSNCYLWIAKCTMEKTNKYLKLKGKLCPYTLKCGKAELYCDECHYLFGNAEVYSKHKKSCEICFKYKYKYNYNREKVCVLKNVTDHKKIIETVDEVKIYCKECSRLDNSIVNKCNIKGCNIQDNKYLTKYNPDMYFREPGESFKYIYRFPVCYNHINIPIETKKVKYCYIYKKYFRLNQCKQCLTCQSYINNKFINNKHCLRCTMVSKIQCRWQYLYWNPNSSICKKRLNREYTELFG
jgi:hypothetical protein